MLNRLLHFVLAVLVCAAIISIGSTQIVLASITSFGLDVTISTRLSSTFSDLLGLGPIVAMIVTAAYLIGFIVAFLLSKLVFTQHTWGVIAGLTSVPTAVALMNHVLDLDILIITRDLSGWLLLIVASLVGSLVFYREPANEGGIVSHENA